MYVRAVIEIVMIESALLIMSLSMNISTNSN